MRTVVLLISPALSKLNASEYLNLMTRLRTLIETATPTALGLTDEEFEEFKALVAKLQNRVNYTSASALTAQLDGIDKQRDSLLTFLFSIVQNGVNLPLEAQRAAAEALALIIRPYANIQRLPGQQETVQVNGLLVDLAAEAAAAHVTTLNLTAVVEALKEQNDQYAALTQQRTLESDAKATENIAELRARMEPDVCGGDDDRARRERRQPDGDDGGVCPRVERDRRRGRPSLQLARGPREEGGPGDGRARHRSRATRR